MDGFVVGDTAAVVAECGVVEEKVAAVAVGAAVADDDNDAMIGNSGLLQTKDLAVEFDLQVIVQFPDKWHQKNMVEQLELRTLDF